MPRYLHLLKSDSGALALPVIERVRREPDASVTVVLLHGAAAPAFPPGIEVRRLAEEDLDYPGLLDLIFDADHVVAW